MMPIAIPKYRGSNGKPLIENLSVSVILDVIISCSTEIPAALIFPGIPAEDLELLDPLRSAGTQPPQPKSGIPGKQEILGCTEHPLEFLRRLIVGEEFLQDFL